MICDYCEYCSKILTEKGRVVSCRVLDKEDMELNIKFNHCIILRPKKIKKRRKK